MPFFQVAAFFISRGNLKSVRRHIIQHFFFLAAEGVLQYRRPFQVQVVYLDHKYRSLYSTLTFKLPLPPL